MTDTGLARGIFFAGFASEAFHSIGIRLGFLAAAFFFAVVVEFAMFDEEPDT